MDDDDAKGTQNTKYVFSIYDLLNVNALVLSALLAKLTALETRMTTLADMETRLTTLATLESRLAASEELNRQNAGIL